MDVLSLKNPPGFRTNILNTRDMYLIQFEPVDEDLTNLNITSIRPQEFDDSCNKEPLFFVIILEENDDIYLSKNPENIALEAFINNLIEMIQEDRRNYTQG